MIDQSKMIEIAEYLNGTCKSIHEAEQAFDVSHDDVVEALGDQEIEMCECCNWWIETSELEIGFNGLLCPDCRDEE